MTSNSQVSKKPLSHPGKPPHKDMGAALLGRRRVGFRQELQGVEG
jgi:hypothetical protein